MSTRPHTFVIAEAGVNHNGSLSRALEMVETAAAAGADAVKFQTFRAEELVTPAAPQCAYQAARAPAGSQYAMLRELELSDAAHREIALASADAGIEFMSTAFDPERLSFLVEDLGVVRLKIASGEITNPLLLAAAGRTGRPVLLSTGMATLDEVEWALRVLAFGYLQIEGHPTPDRLKSLGNKEDLRAVLSGRVTVLQCTSAYPTPYSAVNLRTMDVLGERFGLPVGLSDHTFGTIVAVAGVARGAAVVEKHFTLDRSLPGPDHRASLDPAELRRLIEDIRIVEQALGEAEKRPQASEEESRRLARRRVVATCAIRRGDPYTPDNVAVRRAESGLPASRYWEIVGGSADRDYALNEPIER